MVTIEPYRVVKSWRCPSCEHVTDQLGKFTPTVCASCGEKLEASA